MSLLCLNESFSYAGFNMINTDSAIQVFHDWVVDALDIWNKKKSQHEKRKLTSSVFTFVQYVT